MFSRMYSVVVSAAFASLVACGQTATEPAPDGLGVSRYQIIETPNTELTIRGLDRAGAVIAEARLRHGQVVLFDDERVVEGRELKLVVRDQAADHTSEGFAPLVLPLPDGDHSKDLRTFLNDARITPVLQRWGLGFTAKLPPVARQAGEAAFAACTYASGPACTTTGCCQEGAHGDAVEQRCCGNLKLLVQRTCTAPSSTSACGPTGPNGCAVCWTQSYTDLELCVAEDHPFTGVCHGFIALPAECGDFQSCEPPPPDDM
jgi:hypothetical protein